jgi:hypothetical protein
MTQLPHFSGVRLLGEAFKADCRRTDQGHR